MVYKPCYTSRHVVSADDRQPSEDRKMVMGDYWVAATSSTIHLVTGDKRLLELQTGAYSTPAGDNVPHGWVKLPVGAVITITVK